jgi:hypothetical protein
MHPYLNFLASTNLGNGEEVQFSSGGTYEVYYTNPDIGMMADKVRGQYFTHSQSYCQTREKEKARRKICMDLACLKSPVSYPMITKFPLFQLLFNTMNSAIRKF